MPHRIFSATRSRLSATASSRDLSFSPEAASGGRPSSVTALRQLVLDGPEVESTGVSAWTLAEKCREVETRWGVRYHAGHMSKLVRALGLSRQKARPSHPKADPAAREAFAKDPMGHRTAERWLGSGSDHLDQEAPHGRHPCHGAAC